MTRRPRLLLLYHRNPTTTAAYLESALRRLAEVTTAGAGQEIELSREREVYLPRLLDRVGREFELMLEVEGENIHATGHREAGIPSAWWAIDSHLHLNFDHHFFRASGFDHVFVAQKHHVVRYQEWAWTSASWLPLAADPEVFHPLDAPPSFDLGFVGSVLPGLHEGRRRLLMRLFRERRSFLLTRGVWREAVAQELSRCRLVFNRSLNEDVNMRVFETLATGRPLLTDRLPEKCGLEELVTPGEHVFLYDDERLEQVVDDVLLDGARAEEVARAGRARLLEAHTYDHRAGELLRVLGLSTTREQVAQAAP